MACCRAQGGDSLEQLHTQLHAVQSRLMDVGSAIATPLASSSSARLQRVAFDGAAQVFTDGHPGDFKLMTRDERSYGKSYAFDEL